MLSRGFTENPNKSCETILLDHEWKALLLRVNRRKTRRTKPPPIKEIVFSIAKLGGFLGRRGRWKPRNYLYLERVDEAYGPLRILSHGREERMW